MSSFIESLLWFLLFSGGGIYLAYNRVNLLASTVATGGALLLYTFLGPWHFLWDLLLWIPFVPMVAANMEDFRREKFTRPALAIYRKMLPSMSDTEREALEAGSVWWDGELFSGMPDWDRLTSFPAPKLSDEEQDRLSKKINDLKLQYQHQ